MNVLKSKFRTKANWGVSKTVNSQTMMMIAIIKDDSARNHNLFWRPLETCPEVKVEVFIASELCDTRRTLWLYCAYAWLARDLANDGSVCELKLTHSLGSLIDWSFPGERWFEWFPGKLEWFILLLVSLLLDALGQYILIKSTNYIYDTVLWYRFPMK